MKLDDVDLMENPRDRGWVESDNPIRAAETVAERCSYVEHGGMILTGKAWATIVAALAYAYDPENAPRPWEADVTAALAEVGDKVRVTLID